MLNQCCFKLSLQERCFTKTVGADFFNSLDYKRTY